MSRFFRRPYLGVGIFLLLSSLCSLFLRLDYANSSLILKELRIPRLLLSFAVGGGLALSGLVLQTVLSNPLAEPYTLGIASGAALGAAIGMSLGIKIGLFGLNVGAVFGAIAVLLVLNKLVIRRNQSSGVTILVGVMLSLTCASLLAIWMAIADPMGVQSINFWLLGDLSRVGFAPALSLFFLSLVIAAYFFLFSRKLDAFLFGEDQVESFGVSLEQTQKISILLVSILIGFCVSAVGMIGFVGLVIPHLVRRFYRLSLHRSLIPLVFIWGAAILTFSDSLARVVSEPHELPVGAITAIVGAPVFIAIFLRRRNGGELT